MALHERWAKENRGKVVGTFVVLGLIGGIVATQQARRSEQASAKLDSSLGNLGNAAQEISRVQGLNTKLQQQLLKSNDTIQKLSQQNLDQLTGGNSHVVVVPNFLLMNEKGEVPMFGFVRGENTMWDVSIQLRTQPIPKARNLVEAFSLGSSGKIDHVGTVNPKLSPKLRFTIQPTFLPDKINEYHINVEARNGITTEILRVRLNSDTRKWQYSYTIVRGKKTIEESQWITNTYVGPPF
ncbi:MAG: hypothetical protein A3H28_06230 [Acidobacteria bacterium RIFCSPLOWO2_02_FULL_61_28]|nr:MAG: hypothetical protein A3H28_06230 [Acidobacteria bacterium RIFCSPLOWO2_02_FULL_61_28]